MGSSISKPSSPSVSSPKQAKVLAEMIRQRKLEEEKKLVDKFLERFCDTVENQEPNEDNEYVILSNLKLKQDLLKRDMVSKGWTFRVETVPDSMYPNLKCDITKYTIKPISKAELCDDTAMVSVCILPPPVYEN